MEKGLPDHVADNCTEENIQCNVADISSGSNKHTGVSADHLQHVFQL